jgi:hypothetical protein
MCFSAEFPEPGWWKGLGEQEFDNKFWQFLAIEYDPHKLCFTHDWIMHGAAIGEFLLLEELTDGPPWLVSDYEYLGIRHFLPIAGIDQACRYTIVPRNRNYELRARARITSCTGC